MNKLIIITGASGAGKTTIAEIITPALSLNRAITAATRAIRPGEVDGVNYYFMDENRFRSMIVGIWEERDILVERLIGRGADGNIDDRIQKLDEEMKEVFELRNYPNTILIQNRTGKQDEVAKEVISKIKEFINS